MMYYVLFLQKLKIVFELFQVDVEIQIFRENLKKVENRLQKRVEKDYSKDEKVRYEINCLVKILVIEFL